MAQVEQNHRREENLIGVGWLVFLSRANSPCGEKETKGGEPPNVSAILILRLSGNERMS